MKKSLLTLAIVLLAVAVQAQTAIKVHDNGQISLQSATSIYGIQIPSTGVLSVEPNISIAYSPISLTKLRHSLALAWPVKLDHAGSTIPADFSFYVLGNGNVFAYGNYFSSSPLIDDKSTSNYPIEGASDLVSMMKGYYLDSNEFEGVSPDDFENNEYILPEAIEGLLSDLEKNRIVGMYAMELENVLPEAVRHCPDGTMAINYDAIIPVLVEAFKEQQSRIEQLESILRGNGMMKQKQPKNPYEP